MSGASRATASQRFFSISSVFGGKNSNETRIGCSHHATSRASLAIRRRGSRASQSDTATLPSEPGSGERLLMQRDVEARGRHPLRHGLRGKSEAAVRVLLAQEFQIVRREIDHQQPAAGRQHARRFADRARAVVEEVQHLMDDDDVEGAGRHREIVDVALPHAAMAQARALDAGAGEQQHVERKIDAETALEIGPEHFQDAAGAGAEIEQRAERPLRQRLADRVLRPPRR